MARQVFAIGGKFNVEPWQQPLLQRHLLGLAGKAMPKVCLMAGASGDNPTAIELFYRDMGQHDCRLAHLNMYKPVTLDFADFLGGMDIVYVSGGATRNLVAVWRDWGVDVALRTAWEAGVVMSGTSAGAICWFDAGLTDSFPPVLLPVSCIGLIKGSICPHYDGRPDRPPRFRHFIAEGGLPGPGIAVDDDAAAHFIDDGLHEIVSQRAGAGGHRVTRGEDGAVEELIAARFLG